MTVTEQAHPEFIYCLQQLKVSQVTLRNKINKTTPPMDFKFIDDYEPSPSIYRLGKKFQSECDYRPDNSCD